MRKITRTIIASLVFMGGMNSVQAALIANGDFTTDTATGLDWLDHSITADLSFNQVTAELGAGGLFEGWQVATLVQAQTYLTNAGWIGPLDSGNNLNVGFVSAFEAMTTDSLTFDPLGQLGMDRFTFDPADDLGALSLVDTQGSGITSYSFTVPADPSIADSGTSTFLVRATVVPVPAAIWLFGSGIFPLLIMSRRKRVALN